MRQAGDVLFSQVYRDRGGKLDLMIQQFVVILRKNVNV